MNRNFAKLEENNRIIYAPDWVIRVDHHHDEWDEPVYDEDGNPVIDPETGEQKTEHKTQDWDVGTKFLPIFRNRARVYHSDETILCVCFEQQ